MHVDGRDGAREPKGGEGDHAAEEDLSARAWLDELQQAGERELAQHVDRLEPKALGAEVVDAEAKG